MTQSNPTTRLIVSTLAASLLALFSSGCVTHNHYTSGAPVRYVQLPPPAPADGYLYAFDGVTLVFDGSWGGYRVRGHADHYFHMNFYYRFHDGVWQRCARLAGPWIPIEVKTLPGGLRKRHAHREQARDHREERREVRHERRDEAKEQRAERRDEAKDRREVRHERRDEAKERREAKQKPHGKDDAASGVPANQAD